MFLLYLGLTIAGVIWAFLLEDGSKLRDSSALCLFWSWYNIIVLTIACLVCIEQPRYRTAERLSAGDTGVVEAGGARSEHRILDISLGGVRLEGPSDQESGAAVTFAFEGLRLPATVVRIGDRGFALRFDDAAAARADLIRLVYSGRFSASVSRIEPTRVAAAVIGRVMR
jgi:cellulose synthase (UDP-forming)